MKVVTVAKEIDDFIFGLDADTNAKVARIVDLLMVYGYKIGMPYSRSIRDGIFELRVTGKIQVRILYCYRSGVIYFLNAFVKKTQAIPKREVELALRRRDLLV